MHPYLNVAVDAARRAGREIAKSIDNLDRISIKETSPNIYTTNVNSFSERIILELIEKSYPEHGIISADLGSVREDAEYVWVVEPLDGTLNFIHGFPQIAISIAIIQKGVTQHSLIYDPLMQELFLASKGSGASLNGRRIRVSVKEKLDTALIGTWLSAGNKSNVDLYAEQFKRIMSSCQDVRNLGTSSLNLAYVASGRLDGFWGVGYQDWEQSAGALLVREAGGYVSCDDSNNLRDNVVAGAPKLHAKLLSLLGDL